MRQPNIIYIFADQMRAHALGCYGNTNVPTPNFDDMAQSGMVFDNAISTWSVCSPHRGMLLTGLHPMNNGVVSNDVGHKDGLSSIATACNEQGYQTGYLGKWHLEWNREPFVPKDRRLGFDYWAANNCTHQYLDHFYCMDTPEPIHFKGYDAEVQTELAIDYIKTHQEKPFCLFLSWGPPHDPYLKVPEKYKSRIDPDKIELRPNVSERAVVDGLLSMSEPSEELAKRRKARRDRLEDDHRLKHEELHGYYAHTSALDDYIGEIRSAIKEAGLADNTILVFSSDHGDMLGSHRMALKQNPHEESIRIPFIVEYPDVVPKGERTQALISPIDVMPTLLSLAGLDCPKVDGKDIAPAARGEAHDQQDAVLITKMTGSSKGDQGGGPYVINNMLPWRGVRTKRYTYARLVDHGPWLLYDNQEDPFQLKNLINDPEYSGLQASLEKRTQELMDEAGDPGNTDEIHAYIESRRPSA
jgi:arylsulfatase A-like enzyme